MVTLPYQAASVYAVLSPTADAELLNAAMTQPIVLRINLDGDPLPKGDFGEDIYLSAGQTKLRVVEPRIYTLTRHVDVQSHELCLLIEDPGLTFYRFSFGSSIVEEPSQ
jgi:hypothetical protein